MQNYVLVFNSVMLVNVIFYANIMLCFLTITVTQYKIRNGIPPAFLLSFRSALDIKGVCVCVCLFLYEVENFPSKIFEEYYWNFGGD